MLSGDLTGSPRIETPRLGCRSVMHFHLHPNFKMLNLLVNDFSYYLYFCTTQMKMLKYLKMVSQKYCFWLVKDPIIPVMMIIFFLFFIFFRCCFSYWNRVLAFAILMILNIIQWLEIILCVFLFMGSWMGVDWTWGLVNIGVCFKERLSFIKLSNCSKSSLIVWAGGCISLLSHWAHKPKQTKKPFVQWHSIIL